MGTLKLQATEAFLESGWGYSRASPALGGKNLVRRAEGSRAHLRPGLKMFLDCLRDKMLEGMRDVTASQCTLKMGQTRKCCPVYKLMNGREQVPSCPLL